jgi:hypothetical protein
MVVLGVGAVSYERGTPVNQVRLPELSGGVYFRGTSLISNAHPPMTNIGPYA